VKNSDNYRRKLQNLLEWTLPRLAASARVEFKNCFGATAGYVDGRIFVSCGKFGVALRLPSEILEQLFREPRVSPLRYFPNGHVKKEYAVLSPRILRDRLRLRELMSRSVTYVVDQAAETGRRRR
jgi:hypothetical protein